MIRRLDTAVPAEVLRGADAIKRFAAKHSSTDDWSVYGLGPVHHRDARIAEQQREIESRDRLVRTFVARETTARKMITDRDARIAALEAAIDKLIECKGRYHTEQNFKALQAVRKGTK